MLDVSVYKLFTSLDTFNAKCLLHFTVFLGAIVVFISISDCSLLVYKNVTIIDMLVLCPTTLLNLLVLKFFGWILKGFLITVFIFYFHNDLVVFFKRQRDHSPPLVHSPDTCTSHCQTPGPESRLPTWGAGKPASATSLAGSRNLEQSWDSNPGSHMGYEHLMCGVGKGGPDRAGLLSPCVTKPPWRSEVFHEQVGQCPVLGQGSVRTWLPSLWERCGDGAGTTY